MAKDGENNTVVYWENETRFDLSVEHILSPAGKENFKSLTIVGWIEDEEGNLSFYLDSTYGIKKDLLWDLYQAQLKVTS